LKKFLKGLGTIVVLGGLLGGCSFLQAAVPALTSVAAKVADAQAILAEIKSAIDLFYLLNPKAPGQIEVAKAYVGCQRALDAAVLVSNGVKDMSASDESAAFAKFRQAWAELDAVLIEARVDSDPKVKGAVSRFRRPLAAE
jgi:hypothetical protein